MRVRATKSGFYIGPRKEGDEFDMPDNIARNSSGKLASWLEEVKPAPVAESKKAKGKKEDGSDLA